ncbi:hypothetical protein Dimus_024253, partial [Dionaea muscipula]
EKDNRETTQAGDGDTVCDETENSNRLGNAAPGHRTYASFGVDPSESKSEEVGNWRDRRGSRDGFIENTCAQDRPKWENLFKKRMLVHVDVVKEFYAKMTVIHLKKKDVVKSSVKGISIEFDHERLAAILDVPGRTGICEYIKEVWEESRYTKPLDITRRIANDETITAARRVKSSEMKPFQRFIHFLVMKNDHESPYGDWLTLVFEAFGVPLVIKKGEEPKKYDFFEDTFLTMCKLTRENGIWWIGSGENKRRDDDEATQEEEAEDDDEGNKDDFGWEAEFERKRANRFHDDLEKAKAENARLLALLHQAQSKSNP